ITKMNVNFTSPNVFTCNTVLVGLSIGYFYELTWLVLFLVICSGIFSFIATAACANFFSKYLSITTLSLPFVVISSSAYFESHGYLLLQPPEIFKYEAILSSALNNYLALPSWLYGFFLALGTIVFTSNLLGGMIVAIVLAFYSRILFFLALFGYLLGSTVAGLLTNSLEVTYLHLSNFNYILVAIALGGIFCVPSPKSLLIASLAIMISTFVLHITDLMQVDYGIISFNLAFNIVTLFFLYLLKMLEFPLLNQISLSTPEATLDYYICNGKRFEGGGQRRLKLPFSGAWLVWQGIDGPWTHKGCWKYAFDFVICKTDHLQPEETQNLVGYELVNRGLYKNNINNLNDYYAFKQKVFSPDKGRIVHVVFHLPDNKPGIVDRENNWGNLIILESGSGYFIEISHFAQNSIVVKVGDWVAAGDLLGLCGNSGYSPRPHIHIQVQPNDAIGATTIAFCFQGYAVNNNFINAGVPETGQILTPITMESKLDGKTNLGFQQTLRFIDKSNTNTTEENTVFKVDMNESSEFYLGSKQGRLYFGKESHCFYFYRMEGHDPWLSFIFAALPHIPLSYSADMTWQDNLPITCLKQGFIKHWYHFIQMFNHNFGEIRYNAHWETPTIIKGSLAFGSQHYPIKVVLEDGCGFKSFQIGEKKIERIESIPEPHPADKGNPVLH
ncbi:MAG: peptidoglycan DD-metalloendopeptidase family protein, partial [Francisellaceae bacterium]|nr:peptidoglycan DD-metalloendopeptidase family protein [Francisellaceae bacterium]